jgi:hypothetical protein
MPKQPRKKPSTPAEKEPPRPAPGEQSGSAGRDPGPPTNNPGVDGKPGSGANTGQGNYGQSGYGQGGYRKGGDANPAYQKSVPGRDDPRSNSSNRGSGRPDVAKEDAG